MSWVEPVQVTTPLLGEGQKTELELRYRFADCS
jgi:hypothetical protein